jgi:hypothetical protein
MENYQSQYNQNSSSVKSAVLDNLENVLLLEEYVFCSLDIENSLEAIKETQDIKKFIDVLQ